MRNCQEPFAAKRPLGERALIQRIRSRVGGKPFAGLTLGIGDDCALLGPRPGEQIAVTTDLSIAGRFFDGFGALARTYKTPLAGGDLAESPIVAADIVLVGAVPHGRALLRSGARAGDLLYVTGRLGGAAAGLTGLRKLAIRSENRPRPPTLSSKMRDLLAAHLNPQPRIAQGLWLQRRGLASAAIDLSDGISTDLAHLCEESEVAAEIDASVLPVHPNATLKQALHGGEDYELLFTASPKARIPSVIAGVTVSRIGRMTRRRADLPDVTIRTERGVEMLEPKGWEHFQ
jgi:thiamine-monophosphate kinase